MPSLISRPGFLVAAWFAAGWVSTVNGQEKPPAVSSEAAAFFETSVRPVLAEHCLKCHDSLKQGNGLRLDSRAAILEGGDAGPSIIVGDPDKSPMIQAIRHQGEHKMPPKSKLSDPAVDSLAKWVSMGAPWPEGASLSDQAKGNLAKTHWSFQPVKEVAPPAVKDASKVASPVDAFIVSALEGRGLAPSPTADKRTLIRRASFDLTGLPPIPAEVDAFLADQTPGAFAKVVDRLLASPAYGERWGRHWLDVARYADTKGYVFTAEKRYPYSYTYRDYVIRAFNEDLPFNRFITEQLAADRLPPSDDTRPLAALGFLTVGRRFLNDTNDIIDDRIDVTTRGFLGLTVTCARCHDHKFDPIPTEDYYSLHGVFASVVEPEPENLPKLPTAVPEKDKAAYDAERAKRLEVVAKRRAELKTKVEAELRDHLGGFVEAAFALDFKPDGGKIEEAARSRKLSPERVRFATRRVGQVLDRSKKDHDPVLAPWRSFAAIPPAEFEVKAAELAHQLATPDPARPVDPVVARAFANDPPKTLAVVAKRYGDLFERAAKSTELALEPIRSKLIGADGPLVVLDDKLDRVLDRAEKDALNVLDKKLDELDVSHPGSPPRAMVVNDSPNLFNPYVFVRGNQGRHGKEIPRRFLRVLSPGGEAKPFADGSGRLDLARAIASPDNPLTARVMVNRIWHDHFGAGLVATPSDFGTRGEPPSNPELLDFLARKFVESGWSVKSMHRLILLSNTYQQVSEGRSEANDVDPTNRLVWRQNRRRLDFEALRDGILAVSGQLDRSPGGRPVELFEREKFSTRRTVYGYVDRYDLDPTYRTFDYPSPDISAPLRAMTTVPQQALFLLNSPFLLDQARHLASREEIKQGDSEARIHRLYLDLFSRSPEPHEVEVGRRFVESRPWEEYAQVLLMTNEFTFID